MPRVHRFLCPEDVRGELRSHVAAGMHVGVRLDRAGYLFVANWDRDARDLGRAIRSAGLKVVVRAPGPDLPLDAADPYVSDHVRACHDRAIAVAMHLGAQDYLVRLGSLHGYPRSERLTRREAASRMLAELAAKGRSRGVRVLVEQHLEPDLEALEITADAVVAAGASLVLHAARTLLLGGDSALKGFLSNTRVPVIGLDVSDVRGSDLEPRLPGQGQLGSCQDFSGLIRHERIEILTVDVPSEKPQDIAAAMNALVRSSNTVAA